MDARQGQQLITQLATAAKAVHLYPPEHPARTQPLQRVATVLEQALSRQAVAAVVIQEDLLVVDGNPYFDPFPGSDDLFDFMRERQLVRIEFQHGVTGAELRTMIALLALPPEDLANWGNARDYLEKQHVEHILVELDEEDLEQRALQVYTEAKRYIVDLWREARLGNIPHGDRARATMNELGQLLSQDPNLMLGLTMLSDYDNYTFNHSVNVGVFALAMADELGMSADKELIGLGGMLHDVGKTRVPIEIINKPGKLTDDEWMQMRRHPEYSAEIVQQMQLHDIVDGVLQHHCGYNRKGYPELSPTKELSEPGQITAVCDVYDSVTTLRPYQRQFTPQEGIEILLKQKSNGHLNPKFTDTFIRMLGIYPIGTTVRLNSGEVGIVVAFNREHEDQPKLKIVRDARGNLLRIPLTLDLANQEGRPRRIVGTLDPAVLGIRIGDYVDQRDKQG
ncbi:MAG: HD-GYP domain-containing protein [Candidatus Dadabacteria bacterium]|nr:MAG: HD-GYP domain-containing protein [Candidatus Dadabacteria bacterium]